jgi:hypothetical protein
VTCTAESLTPLWHAQRSHWHRCDFWHHRRETVATFKGNIYWKNIHSQIVLHHTYNFHTQKWGLTRDRVLSQRSHWHHCDKNRRLHSRFSQRILIHIQEGFNPCLRGPGEVVWWQKKQRSKRQLVVHNAFFWSLVTKIAAKQNTVHSIYHSLVINFTRSAHALLDHIRALATAHNSAQIFLAKKVLFGYIKICRIWTRQASFVLFFPWELRILPFLLW